MQIRRWLQKPSLRRFVCFAVSLPTLGLWLLLCNVQLLSQDKPSRPSLDTSSLGPLGKRVLEHLHEDWKKNTVRPA